MIDSRFGRLPALKRDQPYKLGQLAELLGVSLKTVTRWRTKGVRRPDDEDGRAMLRCFHAGARWRVMGADVLDFLDELSVPSEAADASVERARTIALRRTDVDARLDAAGF